MIQLLQSLVYNPFDIETEARSSRIGKKILQDTILQCTDIIASDNTPPPPLILPPPSLTPPLLRQADLLRFSPLLLSEPIPYHSSFPALPPHIPLCNKDNEGDNSRKGVLSDVDGNRKDKEKMTKSTTTETTIVLTASASQTAVV